jgi:hypothetical protein
MDSSSVGEKTILTQLLTKMFVIHNSSQRIVHETCEHEFSKLMK